MLGFYFDFEICIMQKATFLFFVHFFLLKKLKPFHMGTFKFGQYYVNVDAVFSWFNFYCNCLSATNNVTFEINNVAIIIL